MDAANTLDIGGAALMVDFAGFAADGKFVIAKYGAGNLIGDAFDSVTYQGLVPSGVQVDYKHDGGTAIALTISTQGLVLLVR